jgi:nitrile hydratase accessory protein
VTDAARAAAEAVPGLPRDADGPVFREPWEAQAFALAVALHERGVFTWPEWAATLHAEIERARAAGDPDTGETYYRHWLAALERLVAEKRVADSATLERYADAWGRAAERTPHGTPIELEPRDFEAPSRRPASARLPGYRCLASPSSSSARATGRA